MSDTFRTRAVCRHGVETVTRMDHRIGPDGSLCVTVTSKACRQCIADGVFAAMTRRIAEDIGVDPEIAAVRVPARVTQTAERGGS